MIMFIFTFSVIWKIFILCRVVTESGDLKSHYKKTGITFTQRIAEI